MQTKRMTQSRGGGCRQQHREREIGLGMGVRNTANHSQDWPFTCLFISQPCCREELGLCAVSRIRELAEQGIPKESEQPTTAQYQHTSLSLGNPSPDTVNLKGPIPKNSLLPLYTVCPLAVTEAQGPKICGTNFISKGPAFKPNLQKE